VHSRANFGVLIPTLAERAKTIRKLLLILLLILLLLLLLLLCHPLSQKTVLKELQSMYTIQTSLPMYTDLASSRYLQDDSSDSSEDDRRVIQSAKVSCFLSS